MADEEHFLANPHAIRDAMNKKGWTTPADLFGKLSRWVPGCSKRKIGLMLQERRKDGKPIHNKHNRQCLQAIADTLGVLLTDIILDEQTNSRPIKEAQDSGGIAIATGYIEVTIDHDAPKKERSQLAEELARLLGIPSVREVRVIKGAT